MTATSLDQPLQCTQRSGGWSGQQSSEAQQAGDRALWFALCCYAFPGASCPRFCSRHCNSGHPHVSIAHLPTPATVTRHLANQCLSLRRGHHLEHFLCQGCHGKRLCVCAQRSVRSKHVFVAPFPAFGRRRSVENSHRAASQLIVTQTVLQPLACSFYALDAFFS
jgi:hypothetical protein